MLKIVDDNQGPVFKRQDEDKMTVEDILEVLEKYPKDTPVSFSKATHEFCDEITAIFYSENVKEICFFKNWP